MKIISNSALATAVGDILVNFQEKFPLLTTLL